MKAGRAKMEEDRHRIEELERKWEDLRVRRILVEKEVNALRRKAAMSPTNPQVRHDLERAERELRKVVEEEGRVREELDRLRGALGAEEEGEKKAVSKHGGEGEGENSGG